jgi:hypothetical protein
MTAGQPRDGYTACSSTPRCAPSARDDDMAEGYWQTPFTHWPEGQQDAGTPPVRQMRSMRQQVPPPRVHSVPAGQQTPLGKQARSLRQHASPGPQTSPCGQQTLLPAHS